MNISWVDRFSGSPDMMVWAMVVACVLPLIFALLAKMAGGFNFRQDNHNPRAFLAKTEGLSARLNAAQQNSFENLPIFLAAVMVAAYCFVPQNIINAIACLYILLRVVYGVAYALNLATFRSIIWFLSLLCCLQLFYFATRMV